MNQAAHTRFAILLADVLQHSDTPEGCRRVFGNIVPRVARLAGVSRSWFKTPRPHVAAMDAAELFLDFGLAAADVLEDGDLSVADFNAITECSNEFDDLLKPKDARRAEAGLIRGVIKEFARMQDVKTPRHIFRAFTDAAYDLLSCPDTPSLVVNLIADAITEVGNQTGAVDEPTGMHERRVLENLFKLNVTPATAPAQSAPAPALPLPESFADLAETVAINLNDDEMLKGLIRLVYQIANERDHLTREMMASTVAERSFTRTCDFTKWIDGVLGSAQPA